MEFPDVNLLQILFFFMTSFIVVFGSLINWLEPYIPAFVSQTFRYGKFSYKGKPSKLKIIEVPKSYFKHFYVFASVYSLFALHLVIHTYLYDAQPSQVLLKYLDFLGGTSRKTNCGSTTVIVALSLLTFQCFRRFYETWFVSVFSKGKINFSQYLVGYIHYWATITAILAEASGFKLGSQPIHSSLNLIQILGVALFCLAWIYQFTSAKILADLRKNLTGHVISTEHKIPYGGLFKYISSPHLTCEVVIYLSLYLILYNNETFKYVLMWVLSNQLETSLLNHWWYKSTFKNYPQERKAFIPFIL